MSIQHDIEKEQEAVPQTFPFMQEEPVFPPPILPQPPQRPPRPTGHRWVVITSIIVMLALVLSLGIIFIPGLIQRPAGQVTPTPTSPSTQITPTAPTQPTTPVTPTPGSETTPTPAPGVVLGPQACPSGTGDPAYWNAIIGTNNGERQVESVSCANIMDTPSLQALVLVRHHNVSSTLDVYVFNNVTNSQPTRIFLLQGLIKGDAKISGYNTVMTAEVDTHSTQNADKLLSAKTPDLFREFDWSAGQNMLVQTAFPGLFPDLTRYQAEADQAQVNAGHQPWKNDPQAVAKALETMFFGWQRTVTTKLLSGGGSHDVSATVRVQEAPALGAQSQGPSIKVTLSRLEGNTHNLWVVIAVEDDTMLTLNNINARSLITSPVTLEGTGAAFEAVIGHAIVYDHLYNPVGREQIAGDRGMGKANYTTNVVYSTSFKADPQEGIVAVYEANGGISNEVYAAVMRKVLLSPEPGVELGEVSCPLVTQQPGYWEHVLGIDPKNGGVGTVSCANLKGDPSLQALVPVYYTDGRTSIIDVYDQITSAQPAQLFSMQTASAMISNVSTIVTADIDPHSSINTGKGAYLMTSDLYREFQWSGKAGGFVQVVFPGMYPDLTRWQAEVDQLAVNQGKDSWKLDAVKTTQRMVAALVAGSNKISAAELVKGGGSRDLTAVVNVTFPPAYVSAIPVTQVALSRLEGNLNGIWEVTAVQTNWLYVYTPRNGATMSSPVTVTGFGPQFEAVIGTVYILDHLYQKIQVGDNFAMAPDGSSPPSAFSLDVKYTSSFQGGAQEGIIELVHAGGPSFDFGAVLTKVLIS